MKHDLFKESTEQGDIEDDDIIEQDLSEKEDIEDIEDIKTKYKDSIGSNHLKDTDMLRHLWKQTSKYDAKYGRWVNEIFQHAIAYCRLQRVEDQKKMFWKEN